jgi:hypothetical protein
MSYVIANDLPFSSAETNPLEALHDSVAFSSMDWGEARDVAWIYGIVCGWDEDDDPEEAGAMRELATEFGWSDEQVARLRALHANFEALRDQQASS